MLIVFGIPAALAALALLIAYICYRIAFYAPPRKPADPEAMEIPKGEIYEPFRPRMENWIRQARAMDREDVAITSFDGLTLRGFYYEYAPGAPIELMLHGYRGSSERDMPGGVQRSFACGRSALVVDQRCSGRSEGRTITFGINERRDVLSWVEFMQRRFGPDVKIILTGISMGGATVLMAGGEKLPDCVIGILADCPYSSAKEIMYKVIREMGLPPKISYPFVKLGAYVFGGFHLEETSPQKALEKCALPVIFFHGENDDFVPCEMSRSMYETYTGPKALVTIPAAGHGLSYAVEPERYIRELLAFFGPEASAFPGENAAR